jgi:hypothetical protein
MIALRRALWIVLCAAVLWGVLAYRSPEPWVLHFSKMHLYVVAAVIVALLCGSRALFGAPSRNWDIAFLGAALLPAVVFSARNHLLRREFGFGELAVVLLVAVAIVRLWRPRMPSLDMPVRQVAKIALVNVAMVLAFLLASEAFVRLFMAGFDPANRTDTQYGNPFWFQFQPFLMFSMDGPVDIRFRNARLPGDVEEGRLVTNNMGFRMTEPVRFDTRRPKSPGERVVLFTGGSAAWGAGATSNDATIAARLQAILNESQSAHRYVVVSLSSAGWIAFQSMLAILTYGPNFDPDWVVVMDGNNDIIAACAESYGAGRDGFSNVFDKYFRSYLYHQPYPPFYRGVTENALVRVSALYRVLTGQRYVPGPFEFTAKWEEVERSLVFYELAHDRLFRFLAGSKIKMLLSSQPYRHLYRADFAIGAAGLRAIAARYEGTDCRKVPHLELNRYFHPRLKEVSQALVARWKGRLDVRYLNMSELLPEDAQTRIDFSWGGSPVHLSDRGQDFLARVYARTILEGDRLASR